MTTSRGQAGVQLLIDTREEQPSGIDQPSRPTETHSLTSSNEVGSSDFSAQPSSTIYPGGLTSSSPIARAFSTERSSDDIPKASMVPKSSHKHVGSTLEDAAFVDGERPAPLLPRNGSEDLPTEVGSESKPSSFDNRLNTANLPVETESDLSSLPDDLPDSASLPAEIDTDESSPSDNHKVASVRPKEKWNDLISAAIKSSSNGRLNTREIMEWIKEHYRYYREDFNQESLGSCVAATLCMGKDKGRYVKHGPAPDLPEGTRAQHTYSLPNKSFGDLPKALTINLSAKTLKNANQLEPIIYQRAPSTRHLKSHNSSCLLYTSPSPRDRTRSRMPSSA